MTRRQIISNGVDKFMEQEDHGLRRELFIEVIDYISDNIIADDELPQYLDDVIEKKKGCDLCIVNECLAAKGIYRCCKCGQTMIID